MLEPGIIFFVGLLCLACLFLRRAAKIEALEQHGVRVMATITSIEPHAMFTRVTARLSASSDAAGLPPSQLDAVQPALPPARKAGADPGGPGQLPVLLHAGGTLTVACRHLA
jgi:hypothetical protein